MDHLWTPWRFHYIQSTADKSECVSCRVLSDSPERDQGHFILVRGRHCLVLLNRFPYRSGHLMVVLFQHKPSLRDCEGPELEELIQLSQTGEWAPDQVYSPEGFNIGFNIGLCAGAGVAGHLHMHLVPRWTGDANFVSVVGQTRTIPESLEDTYRKLLPRFQNR